MNKFALIEGIVFVAGDEGITIQKISKQLNLDPKTISDILMKMKTQLDEDPLRGITLMQTNKLFKFTTKQEHSDIYKNLITDQTNKLSTAALETLAIIAYKGPIVKNDIEHIRGVNSDAIVAKLKARELIVEVGRSDKPGKPILYSVSQHFLDYFNLQSLDHLPPLPEILKDEEETTNLFSL